MRFLSFVVSTTIFVATAVPDENLFQDNWSDITDLSSNPFASQDLPENSQLIDGDNGDDSLFDDDSNAPDIFPIEMQDNWFAFKPSPSCNEQSSNKLRVRDDSDNSCTTKGPVIPLKKEQSNQDWEILHENMGRIFWPPDAPDISEDSRCLTNYPYHLCCMELSDPLRIVPGELIPGLNVIFYEEAYTCVQGSWIFSHVASFSAVDVLWIGLALASLRVPCFRPFDVCCQTTSPTLGSLDGSVDGYTCYKFSAGISRPFVP